MMPASTTPTIGARVMTADGQDLGTVKEVVGACFKVDAPMRPDYWLGTDAISSTVTGDVHLTFTKDRLGEAKQDGPGDHTGYHPHQ